MNGAKIITKELDNVVEVVVKNHLSKKMVIRTNDFLLIDKHLIDNV